LQNAGDVAGELTHAKQRALARFSELYSIAEVYYAYHLIHEVITKPFRDAAQRAVFNAARFLLTRLAATAAPPRGVSLSNVVFVLAQEAQALGAWKLARFSYLKLQSLKVCALLIDGCLLSHAGAGSNWRFMMRRPVLHARPIASHRVTPGVQLPAAWQSKADIGSLLIRSKPLRDDDSVTQHCFRCSSVNPLFNPKGDVCSSCGAEAVRSFASFEALPVVEFELAPGISEEEAESLLGSESTIASRRCGARLR
jgi:intraflagellar transport protein 122